MKKPFHADLDFMFGETVYLKLGDDMPGMITGISFYMVGVPMYVVSWGNRTDTRHYAAELTYEAPVDYAPVED